MFELSSYKSCSKCSADFKSAIQRIMKASILEIAIAALLVTAGAAQCPSGNWTLRGDSCYQWFSNPQYWYDSEQVCLSHQAHLVSIGSENENTLVGRLAQCRDAWIGRFGTNLYRLRDPTSYAWTDGSDAVSFERHNFTRLDTVHKTLIRSDGEWWLNSLYHQQYPFVCEKQRANATTRRCPNGWTLFNNHCYLMPEFESNFNEANFYCQRKSSQLVSVLSESELSLINNLTFGIGTCRNPLDTVWIGLIKLNPCFPDSGGRELCYQWTDFSGKHLGFPKWHAGHPDKADWTVNCVTLTGDGLRSVRCHSRHRFVCKSPAGNDTGGSVDGVVAAFDFRKGLKNLVDPNTYVVRNEFGVNVTSEDGACFISNNGTFRIGESLKYHDSLLSQPQWTVFLRSWAGPSGDSLRFLWLYGTGLNNIRSDPDFYGEMYSNQITNNLVTRHYEYSQENYNADRDSELDSDIFEYPEMQSSRATLHQNRGSILSLTCNGNWCNWAISITNGSATFHFNERSVTAAHWHETIAREQPDGLEMRLGYLSYNPKGQLFCVRCFGIAHKQLSSLELQLAFATYCP